MPPAACGGGRGGAGFSTGEGAGVLAADGEGIGDRCCGGGEGLFLPAAGGGGLMRGHGLLGGGLAADGGGCLGLLAGLRCSCRRLRAPCNALFGLP